jgi:hypothetical protein
MSPDTTTATTTTRDRQDFADVVARVRSGVVRIDVNNLRGPERRQRLPCRPRLVATVQHVVDGASRITSSRAMEEPQPAP